MTEENTNNSEKTGFPDGSTKVIHTRVETLKMKTNIKTMDGKPIGQTGKGVRLTYEDQYGTQILQLPEMKFGPNGMKVQANKDIYAGLQALQEPVKDYLNSDDDDAEGPEITLNFTKNNGYWDLTNLQLGHVGDAGVVDPTKQKAGGSYNPEGAIIGKLQNNAIELAIKQAGKDDSFDTVIKRAIAYLEGADASLYARLDVVAKAFYKATTGASAGQVQPVTKEANGATKPKATKATKADLVGEDDDMEDDDIPF
jgi:hypothetical protein